MKITKEYLKIKYEDFFNECYDFSIRDGWLPLIEVICSKIFNKQQRLKDNIILAKNAKDNEKSYWYGKLDNLEQELKDQQERPFKIKQIKEKFGGLRFYADGMRDGYYSWIEFAEALSYKICENCGNPAQARTNGWIKILCISCAQETRQEFSLVNQYDIELLQMQKEEENFNFEPNYFSRLLDN